MPAPIQKQIKQSIREAEGLFHRLVLLVGKTGSGKTRVLQNVAKDFNTSVININLELSKELLELTAKQRALRLPDILNHIIEKATMPVVMDNIEILFDKDLKQDPLRLLQRISRNHTIITSWNGSFANKSLLYAGIGHSEYRNYQSVDALIINIDDTQINRFEIH